MPAPIIYSDYKNLKEKQERERQALEARLQATSSHKRATLPSNYQGPVDHSDHMTYLKDEGWVGAILVILFKELFLEILFHSQYFKDLYEWEEALEHVFSEEFPHGIEYFSNAYVKNANGFYPPLYPIDPKTGKPDVTQNRVSPRNLSLNDLNTLIIQNGYSLTPAVTEGLMKTLINVRAKLQGAKNLSSDEFVRLYHQAKSEQQFGAEAEDTAADVMVRNRVPVKPAP